MSTIRVSFDLDDRGSFYQAVQESHRQRAVGEVLGPLVEVDIGSERCRAVLIPGSNDFVEQMGGLRTLQAFNSVEPELIDN